VAACSPVNATPCALTRWTTLWHNATEPQPVTTCAALLRDLPLGSAWTAAKDRLQLLELPLAEQPLLGDDEHDDHAVRQRRRGCRDHPRRAYFIDMVPSPPNIANAVGVHFLYSVFITAGSGVGSTFSAARAGIPAPVGSFGISG